MANTPVLKQHPTLADLQQYVRDIVAHRQLNDSDLQAEFIMLIEEIGELAKAIRKYNGGKFAADTTRKDIEHEVGDVLMLFVGTCNILGIDIEQALRAKEAINSKRTWE